MMSITSICKWLHEELAKLTTFKSPFELETLPENGVYFFYEAGENWGHGSSFSRIVRVGTHKKHCGLGLRIADHYCIKSKPGMAFTHTQPAPKDRSIFRKNLGRAILNKNNDTYINIWNKDFQLSNTVRWYGHRREIHKEKTIENEINTILSQKFSFRVIRVDNRDERLKIETAITGTLGKCESCRPSNEWLGLFSPIPQIRESGLWQTENLGAVEIQRHDEVKIQEAVRATIK